ncbi:MAG: hypothetical protein M3389_05510 [Actinomycetota bacterium]|nr:hypothetical protein [Actinomycetota bacterium]
MPGGRYEKSARLTYRSPGGVTVTYLAPRMIPVPPPPAGHTTVGAGEVGRPDLVAGRALNDPLAAWRIADANLTISPLRLAREAGTPIDVPGSGL